MTHRRLTIVKAVSATRGRKTPVESFCHVTPFEHLVTSV